MFLDWKLLIGAEDECFNAHLEHDTPARPVSQRKLERCVSSAYFFSVCVLTNECIHTVWASSGSTSSSEARVSTPSLFLLRFSYLIKVTKKERRFLSTKVWSKTSDFIIHNNNASSAPNQHIRMISDWLCDTVDWTDDADNSALSSQ